MVSTTWTMLLAGSRMAAMTVTVLPADCDFLPMRIRVLLGLGFGFCCVGAGEFALQPAEGLLPMAAVLLLNICIGLVLGLAARLIFAGIAMGGEYIAQQIGVGLADSMNPQNTIGGLAVRKLCVIVGLSVFVISGGLTGLIRAAMNSQMIMNFDGDFLNRLARAGQVVFSLAASMAGPVILTMFCVTLAVGMVQRTMSSVNVLSVGVSLRTVIGLVMLMGVIAMLPTIIAGGFNEMISLIFTEGLK